MLPTPPDNLIWGWVSTPNQRGTIDILWGNLATTWLCTWTCLCLNIPPPGKRRGWHAIMYKFRWQLFAIFFPEVLVVTALEQWLSAYQSVRMFHQLGHRQWTTRHGFFADMGGIMVAPRDFPPFPVDSQQLAYLVRNKYLTLPDITVDEIKALNKADGLARLVTIIQMTWFCVSFVARGATGLGYSTLEVTTLAFILCTLHTYTLWYCKPLDPQTQRVISIDADIRQICQQPGVDTAAWLSSYPRTPLDFVKSHANSKSPTIPFWYGLSVVFFYSQRAKRKPAQTLPNSIVLPPRRHHKVADIILGAVPAHLLRTIHRVRMARIIPFADGILPLADRLLC